MEAHPHALGRHRSRGGEAGEHGQNDDEADDTSHEVSQGVGGDEGRSEDLGTLAAANVSLVLATCLHSAVGSAR